MGKKYGSYTSFNGVFGSPYLCIRNAGTERGKNKNHLGLEQLTLWRGEAS